MKSLRGLNLSFSILGLANKGLNEAKYKIFGCATSSAQTRAQGLRGHKW